MLVSLTPGASAEDLCENGIDVKKCRAGLAIVRIPVEEISSLDSNKYIRCASLPRRLRVTLDRARSASGINEVHLGSIGNTDLVNGGGSFTGKGVLTALYDGGVDPNHLAFRSMETNESRIKRLWHVISPDNYTEHDDSEIEHFTTDNKYSWHGTHTAAIMSGGYKGNGLWCPEGASTIVSGPIPYFGAAPDAEIAVACGELSEDAIIEGLEHILDYARESGRKPVINLSLGMNGGPLDSSDFLPAYLNEIGREEAIVIVSAGNEGNIPISITHTFQNSEDELITFFPPEDFSSGQSEVSTVFVYSDDESIPEVEIILYGVTEKKIVCCSNEEISVALNKEFSRQFRGKISLASGIDPANGRGCSIINLDIALAATSDILYVPGIRIRNPEGCETIITTDGTIRLSDYGISGAISGNSDLSVNSIAIGENIISVGAYTTRTAWTNLDGTRDSFYSEVETTEGNIADYSSYAIFTDGRTYPTLCAPGDCIISATNSYSVTQPEGQYCASTSENGHNYYWQAASGTSMAAPIVAGTIATWLEAAPNLQIADIKNILIATAVRDEFVESIPKNPKWGAGKLDALAGINSAISSSGLNEATKVTSGSLRMISRGVYEAFFPHSEWIKAEIYSMTGRKVLETYANDSYLRISMANLPSGIYIAQLSTREGREAFRLALR